MIKIIKSYDECRDFASDFNGDPSFSDPMLCHEEQLQHNLIKPIEKRTGIVFLESTVRIK